MQIRRFFAPEIPGCGDTLSLLPEEARHGVQVLRLRPGDQLVLLDGRGTRADAEIVAAGPRWRDGVTCRVRERRLLAPPSMRLHLYVAPPRGKAMGQLVRSATELGVWRIVPILCRRGVRRPDSSDSSWQADALAAVKQSGNGFLPQVTGSTEFSEALASAPESGWFGAVPRPGNDKAEPPCPAPPGSDLALWIGPEGGFEEDEEERLQAHGYSPLALGRWVLRVETAVPALLGHLLGRTADA